MQTSVEVSGLLSTVGGVDPPKTVGEQVEFLFAQQLMHSLSQQESLSGERDGANYLDLLGDHLAHEMVRGGLGLRQQIDREAPQAPRLSDREAPQLSDGGAPAVPRAIRAYQTGRGRP